jgi:polar amino acid transport system substrate-binding protein
VTFNKRQTLAALLTLVLGAASSTALAQATLESVQKAKLVKIAVPTDFPPYGFVGTDLQPQGLDIDMARLSPPSSA